MTGQEEPGRLTRSARQLVLALVAAKARGDEDAVRALMALSDPSPDELLVAVEFAAGIAANAMVDIGRRRGEEDSAQRVERLMSRLLIELESQ